MTRHGLNATLAAVFGTVTFFAFWWLIAGLLLMAMPQLLRSPAERVFGAFIVLMIGVSFLSGILVALQVRHREAPRRHRFGFLHMRLHH